VKAQQILVLAAYVVVVLALWSFTRRSAPSFRYKVTVKVETPEGERSAFAVYVQWAQYHSHLGLLPRSRTSKTLGQAVALDMPNGETLFVLPYSDVQKLLDRSYRND
jgi:hypothetical protein